MQKGQNKNFGVIEKDGYTNKKGDIVIVIPEVDKRLLTLKQRVFKQ